MTVVVLTTLLPEALPAVTPRVVAYKLWGA